MSGYFSNDQPNVESAVKTALYTLSTSVKTQSKAESGRSRRAANVGRQLDKRRALCRDAIKR
jgi:hypothetical protein